ncbi:MAG TPA: ribokinase [Tepidisphaeraceae bacterium]|jgi:ribokinase
MSRTGSQLAHDKTTAAPEARRPRIVVIGSINMDLVLPCARLPVQGETLAAGALQLLPGGKGANQAVAAARLGASVCMIGRVGNDTFGRQLCAGLSHDGVDTRYVRTTRNTPTGTASIFLQKSGENSILLSSGANGKVTPADVNAAKSVIRDADIVLLQLELPLATVAHAIALCRKLKVRTILDPAPAVKLPEAFYEVDVLTPNEGEALVLAGGKTSSPQETAKRLRKRGVKQVVLKLGARGAMHDDGTITNASGFRIKPIDTTAAGDAFTAAMGVGLAEGKEWPDVLRFANGAGALTCTKIGAQPSLPTRKEVDRLANRK